ncbi:hypothetical protein MSSAC_0716 [Methanosarcina siciliae C2J]|uniref:Uncharacterized protein n=3 Tax=Methanosarcina siciliae TaxID=38027 RepID=A0A0E3PAZ9_9EURY|nr:hypothetical protein [Methanosarcina siciliae]AKB27406.1 hypothetical protein MSSIT_0687 [Methanosarcina siciliae T4/M]AKB31349.1 hypothetical protein MSSIH_0659 [Methanosarcina siciliae HI350]AKB35306.1 hypothetical protein MSSAC_0716 [Methanosarcina siciliae C2J]
MFWSKNSIIKKVSSISNTLDDISADIFYGISTDSEYLHKLNLSEEDSPETPYKCLGLNRGINLEREMVHPFIDSAMSNEYAVHPSSFCFMLPYELKAEGLKKEFRLLEPEELKERYPLTYARITKFKNNFKHDFTALSPEDYSVGGCKLLQYLNTPKIIVSDHYSFQASFDPSGNYLFENGCGIVLQDSSRYFYVLAALNSSISRVFSEICQNNRLYNGSLTPTILKRFPLVFPDEKNLESLISILSSYLTYIHGQIYRNASPDISESEYYELLKFYERIVNLLVLDTYFTKDLDPRFLEILEVNIMPSGGYPERSGFSGSEDPRSFMDKLQVIKQNILDTPDFGKCRFNSEFTNILATLKNNGVW